MNNNSPQKWYFLRILLVQNMVGFRKFIGNFLDPLLSLMVLTKYPEIRAGSVLINSAGGLSHRSHELNPVIGTFNKLLASPVIGKFLFNRIRRTLYQVYSDRTAVTDELVDILYILRVNLVVCQ